MISFLIPIYYFLIFTLATMLACLPVMQASNSGWQIFFLALAPVTFTFTYILCAGLLSLSGRAAIMPGTFPRKLDDKVYGPRRLYGACWTAIFYFTPIYFLALTIPPLKKLLFRLFGYSGPMDFVIYPDTWVRDLPCLLFEEGAYIANKTTLGTNMCLTDGNILIDRIKVGKNAMVGHMVAVGPGTKLRENVEIGLGAVLGIRSQYKKNSKVSPCAIINHAVVVGENSSIGTRSYIGLKAVIGDNIHIPAGANIPAGASILKQEEADRYYSSESIQMVQTKENVIQMLQPEAGKSAVNE